ncbi:bis(5'-nucleosyl)-tetraphosphatase PrpE [Salibacterium salarium]|uniref:Bis(5'-nucleosyl)-tetraphosphatase PrpE n=1 Tax=Salibacterium salarium TaxID=284579 RepID=A0A3R9RAL9_9BACI|nr:bis(5'-nucleosyl)-tetraphosphatase PrpE [Salibacterium salarium]RSL31049.1 bis(5'-nucleosyl)-tetraphosphatase PrpE [Salibacterium salarium]
MSTYDFIGDIHGCYDELLDWFNHAGYQSRDNVYLHPEGRIPVFIGDLTDRGPDSVDVIKLVTNMVKNKKAHYVPGNHCNKLYRYFLGRNITLSGGLDTTIAELKNLASDTYKSIRQGFMDIYEAAPLYLRLDHDQVIAAHAGIPENLIGKTGKKVQTFVLYGDITGEKEEDGMPVRRDWAASYKGSRLIVYGHTPVKEPRLINRTINIDTGCVYGGQLTGLHYPEMTFTMVPSTMPLVSDKFRTFEE